jgi:mono/diheme cytochrome c family protein
MNHLAVILSMLLAPSVLAADFAGEALPIFERHCLECHGAKKQKAAGFYSGCHC